MVQIHTFLQKVRKTLKSERGEANYFSTVVFIFIAVILLAFIIDLFSIISTKQELDHAADQMVKQIQLSGGINSETDSLFDFLCSEIEGAENITYSIDATYKSPTPSGMSRATGLPLTPQELRKMNGERVFCLEMNEEVQVVAYKKGFIRVTNDKENLPIYGLTLYHHRPSWCE